MDSLKVRQLIVVSIYAHAEEQSGISPVDDLMVTKLWSRISVRQTRRPMTIISTSTKFDWYFWSRGATRRWTSPRNRTCHFSVPMGYVRFTRITHLLVVIIGNIPFGKSSFPLAILSLEYNQSYASHRTILLTWTKMNRIMMHACWSRHSSYQTWSRVLLRGYRYYIRIRSIALRKWY